MASDRWLERKIEAAAQAIAAQLADPLEGLTTLSSLLKEGPIMRPALSKVVKAHQARIEQISANGAKGKNPENIQAIWAEMAAFFTQVRDLHLPEKPPV